MSQIGTSRALQTFSRPQTDLLTRPQYMFHNVAYITATENTKSSLFSCSHFKSSIY